MGLKQQIERLRRWACSQADYCDDCKYVIHSDNVIRSAEDRAKEVQDNDT